MPRSKFSLAAAAKIKLSQTNLSARIPELIINTYKTWCARELIANRRVFIQSSFPLLPLRLSRSLVHTANERQYRTASRARDCIFFLSPIARFTQSLSPLLWYIKRALYLSPAVRKCIVQCRFLWTYRREKSQKYFKMSCASGCIKYLLFVFNFLFCVSFPESSDSLFLAPEIQERERTI